MKIKYCNFAAYCLFFMLLIAISPFVIPKLFQMEAYDILTNSMEPAYPIGSIVYVKAVNPETIQKDDVITFKQSTNTKSSATHRVVENQMNKQRFITKGDYNRNADAAFVVYERLIGKVVLCIPMLGSFYSWLVSIEGIAVCTFSLIMMVLLWVYVYVCKRNKTKGR